MKRKSNNENFLERIPVLNPNIRWNTDKDNIVTLEIDNKGFYNRIAQKFFKRPPVTYIHLDKTGSFVWPLIDGKKDIITLGVSVKEHFGDEAEPLYERLAKFFQILESYKFILWK